jgi:hypothetical protein
MSSTGGKKEEKQPEGYVAPPPEEGGPAVTTRAQEKGEPSPGPGAMNTETYYEAKGVGEGFAGSGKETDAAKDTEKKDPSFAPGKQE